MNPKIMTPRAYLKLEDLFKKINVLHGIAALLRWDAAVMMPKGSSFIRGDQLAVIDAEIHSLINSKRLSFLLDRAEAHAGDLDDWQGANLVIMRRLWVRARALPKRLITALNRATVTADQRWREAKESNNFKRLAPALEKVVNLTREKAEILSLKMGVTPYEALLDEYDPYRRSEEVETLFKELHHLLPPMIYRVIERQADWSPPPAHLFIPKVRQQHLARKIMKTMGFPFNNGRLDESPHPFTEGPPGDIRMTTCYDPNDIMKGLMGVLHETGHALYDFGLPHQWIHQPVGRDMGMTIHESQALLMEMVVGRTRGFFIFAAPLISRILGVSGETWSAESLYRQATRVKRSLIRMDADELTYLEHVSVRFQMEKEIFTGHLKVRQIPEAWNELMKAGLGISPQNDAEGCLQDSHWPHGYFGYFSTYALGLLTAAQLYQSALQACPEIPREIQTGNFRPLVDWLTDNIYSWGARKRFTELLKNATGRGLSIDPFKSYLEAKYLTDTC